MGVAIRYWITIAVLLVFSFGIYEVRTPATPNAFDQPGAQVPNKLRSLWGASNPL